MIIPFHTCPLPTGLLEFDICVWRHDATSLVRPSTTLDLLLSSCVFANCFLCFTHLSYRLPPPVSTTFTVKPSLAVSAVTICWISFASSKLYKVRVQKSAVEIFRKPQTVISPPSPGPWRAVWPWYWGGYTALGGFPGSCKGRANKNS